MKLATWHWHIEISSKCTLQCPRCARAEVPDSLVNTELDLEFFKKVFTPKFVLSDVEKITFCGDDGDPIYAHELIPVIEYIKSIKPVKIVIVTNGSYKKPEWWTKLGQVLDANDHIHWSLDGWDQHSNEKYRVNCNWESIIAGIQAFKSSSNAYMTWACIAFSFNQDHIESMKLLARTLGFDQFQLTLSTKFNTVYPIYPSGDNLQPRQELISDNHRFQRRFEYFSDRRPSNTGVNTNLALYNNVSAFGDVVPLCSVGNKGLYLNSQGILYPCCWVANRYNHNNDWVELSKQFDLKTRSLDSVLNDTFWGGEFENFRWTECKTKCSSRAVNEQYATEW
jgi:MoaA/NifB/PqqE/SkfB family radical SAM enzyme